MLWTPGNNSLLAEFDAIRGQDAALLRRKREVSAGALRGGPRVVLVRLSSAHCCACWLAAHSVGKVVFAAHSVGKVVFFSVLEMDV
jgi:hypothetical protein